MFYTGFTVPAFRGSPEQLYTYIDVFNDGKFLAYEELSRELNIPDDIIHLDSIQVNKPAQVGFYFLMLQI